MTDRLTLGSPEATYNVTQTSVPDLPPVALTIRTGAVDFTAFITPDEADLLAGWLRGQARLARVRDDITVLTVAALTPKAA